MFNLKQQISDRQNAKLRPFNKWVKGNGAEVGSHTGWLAQQFLKNKAVKHLCIVDPFLPEFAMTHRHKALNQFCVKNIAGFMLLRFSPSRYQRIFKISWEGAAVVPDNSLDFVYIDAGHDEESATKDIHAWWPKVKGGGVIGGHDFYEGCPGVIQAVHKFVAANQLVLHSESYPPFPFNDWWVFKP
jgi:hypothetical protein